MSSTTSCVFFRVSHTVNPKQEHTLHFPVSPFNRRRKSKLPEPVIRKEFPLRNEKAPLPLISHFFACSPEKTQEWSSTKWHKRNDEGSFILPLNLATTFSSPSLEVMGPRDRTGNFWVAEEKLPRRLTGLKREEELCQGAQIGARHATPRPPITVFKRGREWQL